MNENTSTNALSVTERLYEAMIEEPTKKPIQNLKTASICAAGQVRMGPYKAVGHGFIENAI